MKRQLSDLLYYVQGLYNDNQITIETSRDLECKIVEVLSKESKPKKSGKFVELMDNGVCYIIKRKEIASIYFLKDPYETVRICMNNGRGYNFPVPENEEVIGNLIADFKG